MQKFATNLHFIKTLPVGPVNPSYFTSDYFRPHLGQNSFKKKRRFSSKPVPESHVSAPRYSYIRFETELVPQLFVFSDHSGLETMAQGFYQ